MGNSDLVGFVNESQYKHGPRSGSWNNVLKALLRTDRKKFIPQDAVVWVGLVDEKSVDVAHSLGNLLNEAGHKGTAADKEEFEGLDKKMFGYFMNVRKADLPARSLAYIDMPLPIGHGQTCSQPYVVAFMADQLELRHGLSVLEVGAGCGYSAAVTARLIGKSGRLVSAERIPELAELAARNLSRNFRRSIEVKRAASLTSQDLDARLLVVGDDGSDGIACLAPYDRIYVTADVSNDYHFDSDALAEQLRNGCGIVLYPYETTLVKRTYVNGALAGRNMFASFAFVPLVRQFS
ncbi:hypothetical protein HYV82_00360 [Candidatus Woesearchaeota archaeon]|nr:hypothetical protein [Candidatus Woesearchaeota archaeon]